MNIEQSSRLKNPRMQDFVYLIDQLNKIETDALNKIELVDNFKLKECSKMAAFIVTKKYLKSELFLKDWHEAKSLNKEILILLIDNLDNLNSFKSQFQHKKCFVITRSMINNWYNSRDWTFVDIPNQANFFNFIGELKLKIVGLLKIIFTDS